MAGEHAVKADQVQAWPRHQGGQALHAFQRGHLDVRGAVAPGAFQLQHDLAFAITLEPFEFLALMRTTAHPGMQAEAVRLGT